MQDKRKYCHEMDMSILNDKLSAAVNKGIENSKDIEKKKKGWKIAKVGVAASLILVAGLGVYKSYPSVFKDISSFSFSKNTIESEVDEKIKVNLEDRSIGHVRCGENIMNILSGKLTEESIVLYFEMLDRDGKPVEVQETHWNLNGFEIKNQNGELLFSKKHGSGYDIKNGRGHLEIELYKNNRLLNDKEIESIIIGGEIGDTVSKETKHGREYEYKELFTISELKINMKDLNERKIEDKKSDNIIKVGNYEVSIVKKSNREIEVQMDVERKYEGIAFGMGLAFENRDGEVVHGKYKDGSSKYIEAIDKVRVINTIDISEVRVIKGESLKLKGISVYGTIAPTMLNIDYINGVIFEENGRKVGNEYYEIADYNEDDEYYQFRVKSKVGKKIPIRDLVHVLKGSTERPTTEARIIVGFTGSEFITDQKKNEFELYENCDDVLIKLRKRTLKESEANGIVKVFFFPEGVPEYKECDIEIESVN